MDWMTLSGYRLPPQLNNQQQQQQQQQQPQQPQQGQSGLGVGKGPPGQTLPDQIRSDSAMSDGTPSPGAGVAAAAAVAAAGMQTSSAGGGGTTPVSSGNQLLDLWQHQNQQQQQQPSASSVKVEGGLGMVVGGVNRPSASGTTTTTGIASQGSIKGQHRQKNNGK